MRRFSLKNIFNTSFRSDRFLKDRHINAGIKNHSIYRAKVNLDMRCDRLEKRNIDHTPFKILDAPGIVDDFYLNLLDWSKDNILTIGLSESLYQYNYSTQKVSEIFTNNEGDLITGMSSSDDYLAVGCNSGVVKVLKDSSIVNSFKVSETRICALAWNGNVLSCGTKNGEIINYDMRCCKEVRKYSNHVGEVCGLRWNHDKKYLASGGNDNTVKIYELRSINPRHSIEAHKSAVKAMSWCPWKYAELVTAGGTKDKTIKTWDITECKLLNSVKVDSQVCTVNHIPKYKEIITSHGFSKNNIVAWKASSMKEIASFGHHDSRVLNVAVNPEGTKLASVSGDENLKFWKICDDKPIERRSSISFR